MKKLFSILIFIVVSVGIAHAQPSITYFEDFNDGMPAGMIIVDRDTVVGAYPFIDKAWVAYKNSSLRDSVACSASRSIETPMVRSNNWMILPKIHIDENAVLQWDAMAFEPDRSDGYEIMVTTKDTAAASFDTTLFSISHESPDWQTRYVRLQDFGFKNTDVLIAFINNSVNMNALFVDNIKIFTPNKTDVEMKSLTVGKRLFIGHAPFEIKGTLQNLGLDSIKYFNLNYSVNGGAAVTKEINDTTIAGFHEYSFTIDDWTPTETGDNIVKVWISNMNGLEDENHSNDEIAAPVFVYDSTFGTKRTTLLEVFSSAYCEDCKTANENIRDIITSQPDDYTIIRYPMNWPGEGDIYYNPEGSYRKNYYGVNTLPRLIIDGQWGRDASIFTVDTALKYLEVPSLIDFMASYSIVDKTIEVNLQIGARCSFRDDSLRAYIAIVEKETHNNVGTSGETVFYSIFRKMLPDEYGTSIQNLTVKSSLWLYETYTFPDDATVEDYNNLAVVVFLQDNLTKEVLQSAYADYISGVDEQTITGEGISGIYPNPADNRFRLDYSVTNDSNIELYIYNILGEPVKSIKLGYNSAGSHSLSVDSGDLPSGYYRIVLHVNDSVSTKDLLISR